MSSKNNKVLPIVMMFFLFAMISFVTGLSNPMGVIAKNQDGILNWMSQLGNFANFLAYLLLGLPSGILLKKKGYKFTALTAIALGILGVGVQLISGLMPYEIGDNFTPIFTVYLTGALISGFSMCMLNTVVNPMLNTLGGGGKKGNQLIQFGGSLNSMAATIVPILGGYLIGDLAKATMKNAVPALLIAIGIFVVAFIVLAIVAIPEPHNRDVKESKVIEKYSAMSFRHFVLGTVAIFLYVGIEVGIPNFINLYLTAAKDAADGAAGMGIDPAAAGSVVGTYWFLMLIGRLTGGVLGSKFSAKAQLTFVSTLGIIFVALGIFLPSTISVSMPVFMSDLSFGMQTVPLAVMLFTLCGLCTSIMWGGIFNLAVEGIGKYTEMGSGIFMVMVVGGGVLPLIQGAVADLTVSYMASYWVIVAALVYLLWYALAGCKNVNKDIPVE
ncbi:MFS transporter [Carboxylicivirga mesophila]|uniref:MFS transporter n=1 Tax=Carboxylicivirga mesophila TaxID=1166478 RepID=A0ABS5K7K7_9BACT|nr:MFS transporter [Carboxylicivirga mesophila]MBS2210940.1 MFS transporter [Carboxylicivirga mesophila]